MWWAMPGPSNLVWFVAYGLGQIGYVNASVPVAFGLTGVTPDINVQKGSYQRVPISIAAAAPEQVSLNSSALSQDTNGYTPQVYSSSQSTNISGNGAYSTSVQIFAAWNATLGPRVIAVTAYDSHVSLNMFVRVTVVDSAFPNIAAGLSSILVLGGATMAIMTLTRPRRKSSGKSKS